MTEHDGYATLGGRMPTSSSAGMVVNPRVKSMSSRGSPIQKDNADVEKAVSTSTHPINWRKCYSVYRYDRYYVESAR